MTPEVAARNAFVEEHLLENASRRNVYASFEARLLNRARAFGDGPFSVAEIRRAIRRLRRRGELIIGTPGSLGWGGATEAGYRLPFGEIR